jgi:hypothetical protein
MAVAQLKVQYLLYTLLNNSLYTINNKHDSLLLIHDYSSNTQKEILYTSCMYYKVSFFVDTALAN